MILVIIFSSILIAMLPISPHDHLRQCSGVEWIGVSEDAALIALPSSSNPPLCGRVNFALMMMINLNRLFSTELLEFLEFFSFSLSSLKFEVQNVVYY